MKKIYSWMVPAVLLVLTWGTVSAQTFFMQSPPEEGVVAGIRFLHVGVKNFDGQSAFSGMYDLYVRFAVSPRMGLKVAIPAGHLGINSNSALGDLPEDYSETSIGNVYVGLESSQSASRRKGAFMGGGVFLPTADKDKVEPLAWGIIANRFEIWKVFPETWTLYGNIGYRVRPEQEQGMVFGFEAGPALVMPTGELKDAGAESELYIRYGVQLGMQASQVLLASELTGLYAASAGGVDFADRFENALCLGASLTGWPVRPTVFYQLPLNDATRNAIDGVLGIRLEFVSDFES